MSGLDQRCTATEHDGGLESREQRKPAGPTAEELAQEAAKLERSKALADKLVGLLEDEASRKKALAPKIAEVRERLKDDPKASGAEIGKLIEGIAYPRAPWTLAVDHIEHVLKVGGPGSAGLGTDFDGIPDPPAGLEDVSKLPLITEELLRRGHSDDEVRGVLGENFLRFWDRAAKARAAMAPRDKPLPFSKP